MLPSDNYIANSSLSSERVVTRDCKYGLQGEGISEREKGDQAIFPVKNTDNSSYQLIGWSYQSYQLEIYTQYDAYWAISKFWGACCMSLSVGMLDIPEFGAK